MTLFRQHVMAYYVALICIIKDFRDAAMSTRRKTASVTTGAWAPVFCFGDEGWERFKSVCKFKSTMPFVAKDDIELATTQYLRLQQMEAEAVPSANIESDFQKIAVATDTLRRHLRPLEDAVTVSAMNVGGAGNKQLSTDIDRGFQLMHRLEPYFEEMISFKFPKSGRQRPFRNFSREIEVLCRLLACLNDAATEAAKKTRNESDHQLKGDAWDCWVARLYNILTDHGLSATISNDTDKRPSKTETPFLRLVIALQDLLSKEARRPVHSKPALAKAIQRALDRVGRLSQGKAA